MHDSAQHRDRKHALQIAMAIPVHHRNGIPGLDAGLGQGVGQTTDALVEGAVVVANQIAIDDFLRALITLPGQQQS